MLAVLLATSARAVVMPQYWWDYHQSWMTAWVVCTYKWTNFHPLSLLSTTSCWLKKEPFLLYLTLLIWCISFLSRIQLTHRKHVEAQEGVSHNTRSDFRLGHLEKLSMSIVQHAELRGVAILSIFSMFWVTVYPQAMIVCQWLLRMSWEWDPQEHVQHKASVSSIPVCWYRDEQIHIITVY